MRTSTRLAVAAPTTLVLLGLGGAVPNATVVAEPSWRSSLRRSTRHRPRTSTSRSRRAGWSTPAPGPAPEGRRSAACRPGPTTSAGPSGSPPRVVTAAVAEFPQAPWPSPSRSWWPPEQQRTDPRLAQRDQRADGDDVLLRHRDRQQRQHRHPQPGDGLLVQGAERQRTHRLGHRRQRVRRQAAGGDDQPRGIPVRRLLAGDQLDQGDHGDLSPAVRPRRQPLHDHRRRLPVELLRQLDGYTKQVQVEVYTADGVNTDQCV